jgi:ATP synthase protein I
VLPQREKPAPPKGSVQPGDLAGVGLQFAGSIILFLLLGMWLDRKLGTDPWLLIVGVFTGGSAGFWSMYRRLVVEPRDRERK